MKNDSTDRGLDGYTEQRKTKEHEDNLNDMRRIQAGDSCVQALHRAQLTEQSCNQQYPLFLRNNNLRVDADSH
jgi:hypothetical protein